MSGGRLDVVGRTLYRTLLKLSKRFDDNPVLKGLISRNTGPCELPQPLDGVVAAFLGGQERSFYWPSPTLPQSVQETVQVAFRFPQQQTATQEGAFQGIRYLTGLLSVAEKHGILEAAKVAQSAAPPPRKTTTSSAQLLVTPQQGSLLVAHPCLPHWFSNSVVLVCQQTPSGGTYGLCLNKPVAPSVNDFLERSHGDARPVQPINLNTLMDAAEEYAIPDSTRNELQALIEALEDEDVEVLTIDSGDEDEEGDDDGDDREGDMPELGHFIVPMTRRESAREDNPTPVQIPVTHQDGGSKSAGADALHTIMQLFSSSPVLHGGPVPGVQLLHRKQSLGGVQVLPADERSQREGVFLGGTASGFQSASDLMKQQELSSKDVRVFVGDSGWAPMQLESELETGAWIIVNLPPNEFDIFDPAFIPPKDAPPEDRESTMWKHLMKALGAEYAALAAIPAKAWMDISELTF